MTGFLVSLIDFAINFCSNHLPAFDLESSTYNSVSAAIPVVVEFLSQVNFIVPLGDIVVIIMVSIGFRLFKFSLFVGNWIVRRVFDVIP